MKVAELQLGDFVKCSDNGIPMQVVGIYKDVAYLDFEGNESDMWEANEDDLKPIPLTWEILEKNGFEMPTEEGDCRCFYIWEDIHKGYICTIRYTNGFGWLLSIENSQTGQRVRGFHQSFHELQHALRLCEINKQITL